MSHLSILTVACGLVLGAVAPAGAGEKTTSDVTRYVARSRTPAREAPARCGPRPRQRDLDVTIVLAQRRDDGWRPDRGRRWREPAIPERRDTYALLKGGALYVPDGGGTNGLYLGLEVGGGIERFLDVGLCVDYFHRQSRDLEVLFDSRDYQFPVHATITNFESSADLVPLGVTMRLKLPVASGPVAPFVSGTLAYEILHLGLFERNAPPRPYADILGDSETFTGFGWQAAAGVEVALSSTLGIYGEAGLHRSSPSQSAQVDGVPVDLRVDLDGAFLRAGLRFGM